MTFQLAACAEMLWRDRPIDWRVSRLKELGFGVGLWNWLKHDLAKLEATGAEFTIMNGYLRGRLADDEGADELLQTARETAQIGKRLGVARLNLHGTGSGDGGLPVQPIEVVTGAMWPKAHDTLCRAVEMADEEGVVFTLENLNLPVDHPGVPFGRAEDTLALASAIDHPRLRRNLDLYHAQIGEGNLIELCRKSLPWIGEVNWHGIAKALKVMGYAGPVGMEAFASAKRPLAGRMHEARKRTIAPNPGMIHRSTRKGSMTAGNCQRRADALVFSIPCRQLKQVDHRRSAGRPFNSRAG